MGDELNISFGLKRLVGLDKVAMMLDISLREVQRRIAAKELPQPVKIGRLSKLPVEEVLNYVERLKRNRVPSQ
jgi:predicted DNA-binding transcriptional regulator AlpA